MRIALGNVPFEMAKIAACAGRAGNADTARDVFARGLFPEGARERVVDLGTGYGEFAITLARRYPHCSIWAVDSGDVGGLSGREGLPSNILLCGETGFEDFVTVVHADRPELGGPLLFDLAYILFPNPSAIGAFVASAMKVLGDQGEIHLLTEAPHAASAAEAALVQGGFLVRSATLPSELGSLTGYGSVLASSDTVHWVVARRYRPGEFVIPPVGGHPPPAWPNFLQINSKLLQEGSRHEAEEELSALFGRSIDLDLFLHAVGVGVPVVSLHQLTIKRTAMGDISFYGWFVDGPDGRCGSFNRSIPPPPAPGEPWIAKGHGFDAYFEYRKKIVDRIKRGIARSWHQRFLPFLAWLSVDRLEFNATQFGSYAWARLGFDFSDEVVRDRVVGAFRAWLADEAPSFSLDRQAPPLQHAWDLTDVTGRDGRKLGEEFLLQYGHHMRNGWAARFSLHPDYPGWRRLFKDQTGKVTPNREV